VEDCVEDSVENSVECSGKHGVEVRVEALQETCRGRAARPGRGGFSAARAGAWLLAAGIAAAQAATPAPAPSLAPQDKAYPGEIALSVDATDRDHRVLRVHERVSGLGADGVLLFPRWLPGTHGPNGPLDRLAGLRISADGNALAWTRDPLDVSAFRVHAPAGRTLDIDFTYLSPTSAKVGAIEFSAEILRVQWNDLVLYPAGYYVRQIPVVADLTLPDGWQLASAMEAAATEGARTRFRRVSLETLVDSPVLAGRHGAVFDLDPGAAVPVRLDVFADRPELLAVKPEQLAVHRELVQQAYRLFGAPHYPHYDFLYSLSDQTMRIGLEHLASSEDGTDPETFTAWDRTAYVRELLPHEFTHSWNGKFRRPADLWTPNYNVPMQDSLLWVYEGQTQYWGGVLTARSGLITKAQALDKLALDAAFYELQAGRQWRPLQDTTNDEIVNPRRPMPWRDWQRFEDYYREGALIWLEADTLIRQHSEGRRSLDDFARAFFGVHPGSGVTVTYTFEDVVHALEAVEPLDWTRFLRERLDSAGRPAPLEGLHRGGYRLVYDDAIGDYQKARDQQRKVVDLWLSLGIIIEEKGSTLDAVRWDGPAYRAGLTEGAQLLAVNGIAYTGEVLKDAVRAAHAAAAAPLELIVKNGDRFRVVRLDYRDGLRYPHLQRDESEPARLDDILEPRK
jgi:predicted metalloprotease with PDZ domain